ncbi:helicase [Devosia insulae DS-56]|uniref:Helicase n=1 Tax=Devosia insulae DS-56 TaxID=1116389 RepID=A0A1E5XKA1_9HYPH|nr:helicase [Devosia insulae DS-56]
MRIFKKTKTDLDQDLRRLVARGLRRIRRIVSSRRARDILVDVVEVVEDREELAIVMRDPGTPLRSGSKRANDRQKRLLVPSERKTFWGNIIRVAEGLTLCHDAGVIHGSVGVMSIFSHRDDDEDYRLGGYESCVHIGDGDAVGAVSFYRSARAVSFRQDWVDLAAAISEILGLGNDHGPSLLPIERRLLDRLEHPPQFQMFDGHVVLRDLRTIVDELAVVGSNSEGELVLYPSREVLQSDLASLTSETVEADDIDGLLRFVEDDLRSETVRVSAGDAYSRVVTEIAVYGVRHATETIGSIMEAHKRRPDDRAIFDAVEVPDRLYLSRNRAAAEARVLKLGPAARPWTQIGSSGGATASTADVPTWYALILLEAFSLLREQFRIYPVEVHRVPSEPGILWVVSKDDADRDRDRTALGFQPAAEALRREMARDDGKTGWTLSRADTLGTERERRPDLTYEGRGEFSGRRAFTFAVSDTVALDQYNFLRPRRDSGFERAVRRRLQNIVAARRNIELLRALDNPAQVALDESVREVAKPGPPPAEMDGSKREAWNAISIGKSINVVVGPPGVGKTYLISKLVRSILEETPDARVLVSAQNHDTLMHMEDELRQALGATTTIMVRVERSNIADDESQLREASATLLRAAATGIQSDALLVGQYRQMSQALEFHDDAERQTSERVFRDTDNLMLRSSDITLATTSSHVIEEMIADGEQFDWVIVEEAARANGAELIGALLLGNRRLMIGDHNQLSPFDAQERQKFYDPARAQALLQTARAQLETINDLPDELDDAITVLTSDDALLADVLAIAARMEEPFREIAEREERREKETGRKSSTVNMLLEQSRMHPAICEVVSNTFYGGRLVPSERVRGRASSIEIKGGFPTSPIVVLNLPALSTVKKRSFEVVNHGTYSNEAEALALVEALKHLRPVIAGEVPTVAVLTPYKGQVNLLERLLRSQIQQGNGLLYGFASPRGDGNFVFTSDSFQGSEADLIVASLVRNNMLVGSRAIGFMRSPQRLNVLLSRAKQKLVLATSLQFIVDAADGKDPDGLGGELGFLRTMIKEIRRLTVIGFPDVTSGATILEVDERGRFDT